MNVFENVEVGYSLVVGISCGKSSKTGNDFTIYDTITRERDNSDGTLKFKAGQVFCNGIKPFPVDLFGSYMFLYSGNGNYKNLCQVCKQPEKK